MIATLKELTMSEWDRKGPDDCEELRGRFLDGSKSVQSIVKSLNESRLIELTELRTGLEVKAFSHVGRIRIGELTVTILPKLRGASLLKLLRYAYGFRRLTLISDTSHLIEPCGFEDLLVSQLNAEAQELLSRGLQRAYIAQQERLASPRGRIDIQQLALDGGTVTATLPCRHFPRIEDTLLNRVLFAGLRLAGTVASSISLRRESRRLGSLIEEQVSPIALNGAVLEQVERRMNRLTQSYASAMSIIRLLVEAQGVALEGETATNRLPGFLFDMNSFFQMLLSRFLRENLPGFTVLDERALKGMMKYHPAHNPRQRRSPTPRPDYVISKQSSIRAILDAKYRDLWEKHLPREMLYQLVVYAISHHQRPESTILYPTMDMRAREAKINVTDPIRGGHIGRVCLRPVFLGQLEALVSDTTSQGRRDRQQEAMRMAFGKE